MSKQKTQKGNKYAKNIQATLDLHGMYISDIYSSIDDFIEYSLSQNHTTVKIITGKGIHSKGPITIKEKAREYLFAQGFHFNEAKYSEGGSGALVVSL